MFDINYGKWEDFESQLINKRIIEWDEDKLTLEDGTVITIECSEQDCCAWAGGEFKDVKLDAIITEVIKNKKSDRVYNGDGHNSETEIVIFHNRNVIAKADCYANDGNGGYYYSVGSLVIKDVHYKVVSA